MIDIRCKFKQILQENDSKHWSFAVRRDTELMTWINEQTAHLPDSTPFPDRVYSAVHAEQPQCKLGKTRKLKSIFDGWAFCGRAGVCECAREQVSKKVSDSKQSLTRDERSVIQAKREETNVQIYGHRNTGQIAKARIAHQAFYDDADNIRNQLKKQVATMRERYGVDNPAQHHDTSLRRVETLIERHGVSNPMQSKSIAARSLATRLEQGYCEDYYLRNYNKMKDHLLEDFKLTLMTPFAEYEGVAKRPMLDLACISCGKAISWRLAYHRTPRCRICNPAVKSQPEMDILAYVKELGITDAISGDRTLIAPSEIDILSHARKIGIEHSGLYYHCESVRPDKNYHFNKLKLMEAQGYRLITIFGDEWIKHPEIVKSKLCHLFGQITDRRYARKTKIAEIDHRTASAFYQKSHIQGDVRASSHVALMDDEEVIAVMSFTFARESKRLPDNSFELVRFATLPFMTVVGGASKLFSYFVKTRNASAIVSYADRRWSDGGLYRMLGFTLDHTNPVTYDYVDQSHSFRMFRFNFRNAVLDEFLGESDATEEERMKMLNYDRIWDCGTLCFKWFR